MKGADGKSAYEIAVDNGYKGDEASWLASLVGAKGDDGLSAFEIYQKYHPEYTGTEEEWVESLKGESGNKGDQGEQGVGIVNAYINDKLHLILVLSNNTEIDAGYVGVEVAPTYTVTFVDHDGTVLSTVTGVQKGASVTAPSSPTREGYTFSGWDKAFSNITQDLTVTATYTQNITGPTLIVESVEASAGDPITVAVSIKNNPGVLGMRFHISYDEKVLTYISSENGAVMSNHTFDNKEYFYWEALEITEADIKDGEILLLTFTVNEKAAAGAYEISIIMEEDGSFDNDINPIAFDFINGTVTVTADE